MRGSLKTGGLLAALVLLATAIAGCATVVSGKTQSVTFHSIPSGATVALDGKVMGVTPLTMDLTKKANQTLTIGKEGYRDFSTTLTLGFNPWILGNVLLIGMSTSGLTTDGVTGAMQEYSPDGYLVELAPAGATKPSPAPGLSRQDEARRFVMLNYDPLMAELSKGSGDHLLSLLKLLNVPKGEESATAKRISAMSEAYPDIPQFAGHVASALTQEQTSMP